MKKIRWGFIGCGKVVLKNKRIPFINHKNTITAICTTSLDTAQQAKIQLKLKKCTCYTDAEKMIKDDNVDCIYIATPPKFHYIYLQLLSKYNIPIYVEKPFVRNYEEAKRIKKLYNNDLIVFVAHYKRLTKQIKKLRKILEKNEIGEIISIQGIFERKFNKDLYEKSWIYNKDISGGGRFIDIAPHILDTLYYLFGNMKIIDSEVIYSQKYKTEEIVKTNIEFNNCRCNLFFNFNSNADVDKLIVYGKNGRIITSINRDFNIYIQKYNKMKRTIRINKPKVWGEEAINEINYILRNRKRKTNLCTLSEACLIQKYMDMIMKK